MLQINSTQSLLSAGHNWSPIAQPPLCALLSIDLCFRKSPSGALSRLSTVKRQKSTTKSPQLKWTIYLRQNARAWWFSVRTNSWDSSRKLQNLCSRSGQINPCQVPYLTICWFVLAVFLVGAAFYSDRGSSQRVACLLFNLQLTSKQLLISSSNVFSLFFFFCCSSLTNDWQRFIWTFIRRISKVPFYTKLQSNSILVSIRHWQMICLSPLMVTCQNVTNWAFNLISKVSIL